MILYTINKNKENSSVNTKNYPSIPKDRRGFKNSDRLGVKTEKVLNIRINSGIDVDSPDLKFLFGEDGGSGLGLFQTHI